MDCLLDLTYKAASDILSDAEVREVGTLPAGGQISGWRQAWWPIGAARVHWALLHAGSGSIT